MCSRSPNKAVSHTKQMSLIQRHEKGGEAGAVVRLGAARAIDYRVRRLLQTLAEGTEMRRADESGLQLIPLVCRQALLVKEVAAVGKGAAKESAISRVLVALVAAVLHVTHPFKPYHSLLAIRTCPVIGVHDGLANATLHLASREYHCGWKQRLQPPAQRTRAPGRSHSAHSVECILRELQVRLEGSAFCLSFWRVSSLIKRVETEQLMPT